MINIQNSNKPAESKGVVMFAVNNGAVDYERIAKLSAELIKQHTGLPVTIITKDLVEQSFDNYRVSVQGETVKWSNLGRYMAYQLSPYNKTILLDSDYLVFTDELTKIFDTDFDYRLWHCNQTPTEDRNLSMGPVSLPFVWATVVAFRKTPRAKMLFDLVERVQHNYSYYRALYNISPGNYRNDFAFAIANNILNGYNLAQDQSFPGSMLTIDTPIEYFRVEGDRIVVKADKKPWVLPRTDLHIMDKEFLVSDKFEQLVNEQK
jgi:hypothetical protein